MNSKTKYPDVSMLFRMKADWRREQARQPIEQKLQKVERLRKISDAIRKAESAKS